MRPVRCFTCGKTLADKYDNFTERVDKGDDPRQVLDDLGLKRYCCRSSIITGVDFTEEISKFKK